jgi:hypothetical protein
MNKFRSFIKKSSNHTHLLLLQKTLLLHKEAEKLKFLGTPPIKNPGFKPA